MTTTAQDIAIELDQLTRHASTQIKLEITDGTRTWRLMPRIRWKTNSPHSHSPQWRASGAISIAKATRGRL
jgi:hypothetical protein